MITSFSYWHYPTNITLGLGARLQVTLDAQALGLKRPMIVCDPGIIELAELNDCLDQLKHTYLNLSIFHDFSTNPSLDCVNRGIELCLEMQHDGIIAIGGGSAIDVAKAIAFMVHQPGHLIDYEDIGDQWQNADAARILPCIALPTTAGTGAEVGRVAVISDEHTNKKCLIFHPQMTPKKVILDAELTVKLPQHITAATGMDALSHNLESFFSPGYHPMAEGIAVQAIKMIKDSLVRAYQRPDDLYARQSMLVASLMGATAFQKGLGAMHALSHPLGARFNSHHGLLNAILMPYVLQANQSAIRNKTHRLAHELQLEPRFETFVEWILSLREKLGIAHTLAEIGIHDAACDWIAEQAIKDPSAATNPIIFSKEQYRVLLSSAIHGELDICS